MFEKITIVGFGLIGSSLAQAMRRAGVVQKIVAADLSAEVCKTVLEHHLADEATTDLCAAARDADIVILCVPVGAMGAVVAKIAPCLKDGAIISDSGSVKEGVVRDVLPHLPPHAQFVPAHPIAGTEHSGPLAGFPDLFINRWVILTPLPDTSLRAVEKITALWEAVGANIEIMSPAHHDLVLGITSHLPHLIAFTIVGTATNLETDLKSEVIKFSASGFRDFTRIAASNPTMWRDVFLQNKAATLEVLQRFTEDLTALQRAIRYEDGEFLYQTFERTRAIRRAIIEAGQAEYPVAPVPKTESPAKE
ncbi:MAG: prephenate/arogenate dehydrogenase family protein [Rhodospirillales bacterium]|nr:prephenate/arogenate dehydrogenase family protein [Rhodospirillales bacterium]MCB9973588.1 prephenate/arogenate dehydrogenase family protein [Rhodospirillales bacterium]MCB9979608.1 prephenate/arogenate dehydrogenase family protein [Rhodospirillales bacterium]